MAVFEQVLFLEQVYGFCQEVSAFGYIRLEMVTGRTLVDGYRDREMYYHRRSFAASVSGDFAVVLELPFGLASVSGG